MNSYNEALSVKGDVLIIKTDELGRSEKFEHKNLVVSVGKTFFVANISNQDWQLSPTPLNGGIVTCQAQVGTVLMYVGTGWVTINAY